MACIEICTYPDPILKQKAEPIENIDGEISRLIDDMAETMYKAPGIGLAANQVGKAIRLVVVDLQRPEYEHGLLVLINPEIVSVSGETSFEEGCLSVPEYFATVKRAEQVTVCGIDQHGKDIQIEASGLLAVVLQHEIDHLEGKLFVDRLGPIARDIFRRKWKKRLKEAAE
ncbi:MAG: peptide deformylase [Desulforhabdus sp.]|jgi:peptide deformylase|nr:peptide deformylase [Desulforhabdus sp.]